METSASGLRRIRQALRPVRRFLRESRHRLLRRFGRRPGDWSGALPEELQFWESALKEEGRNWIPSDYQERMNPELELQDSLKALIPAAPGTLVRILDVGAGPLTRLGKRWAGRELQLVPLDPLAEEYKALLARLKLQPPVVTEFGHGEKLLEKFGPNYFDLAYASNSLDHSYNPLLAIEQMFTVTKPQCYVYLWHFAQVGVTEGYAGLHQWNFRIKDDDMILSDGRGQSYSLATAFKARGQLECELQKFCGSLVVVGKLKKLAAS